MRRLGLWLRAAFVFAGLVTLARRLDRFAVSGHSMEPTLSDGDWLIVDRRGLAVPGSLVVARDPRAVGRLVVKRVGEVGTDHQLMLRSDHPAHANEIIGPVSPLDVLGVVVLRYWPASRAGRMRRGSFS